tara:strand:- start:807 stop:1244 length:438 start_codon:yes stop_codon:yes gene_type:complete
MGDFKKLLAIASPIIGMGIIQGNQQRDEGKAKEAEFKRAAEMEKISAVERERIRRRELNQILGSTIADVGARGIKSEGSPAAIAKGIIGQSSLDLAGSKVSDLSRISQLKRAGVSARRMGENARELTLLKTTVDVAKAAASGAGG